MPRATEWPQSYWAAIGRDTQSFVGCFQFRPRDNHGGGIELGFRLKLAEWGKGFATEGSRALIAKGFSQLGVRRVFARTMASNAASIQVVEKIGLKSDKTERQVNSVQYKMVRLTILSTRSNSGQRESECVPGKTTEREHISGRYLAMNLLEPWNIVYLVGFVMYFWIRHVFLQRTKNERKAVSRFDRSEKILLAAMFPPVVLLPLLYVFTPLLAFADYQLPPLVLWLGAATMAASLWLFWRSHADLGQNWSVSLEIREGHQLITEGVYRYIRHPMYASIWLWSIAQGMLLQNWLAGWAVVPVFAAMYFLRTPREEQMMCETFGDQYRDYMRRTGRLFPRIKTESAASVQEEN